jgi:hypothetical protein
MSSSGIFDGNDHKSLTVYPNPADDYLTIDFGDEVKGSVKLDIMDISGRQVYSAQLEIQDNSLMIRLPQNTSLSGLHFINVTTDNGVYSSKFMIYRH